MTLNRLLYLFFFTLCGSFVAQAQEVSVNTKKINEKAYRERIINESRMIFDEFLPRVESLHKKYSSKYPTQIQADINEEIDDWQENYYLPLFEAVKKSALRATNCSDERSALEYLMKYPFDDSLIPHDQRELGDNLYSGTHYILPDIYVVALAYDQRKSIIANTIYDDPERQKKFVSSGVHVTQMEGGGMSGMSPWSHSRYFGQGTVLVPPLGQRNGFSIYYEDNWACLLLYSYKDEQARDFFLEIVASVGRGGWSEYFVTLFPHDEEFKRKIKTKIDELADREKNPELSPLFDEHGELINPFERSSRYAPQTRLKSGITAEQWYTLAQANQPLFRLTRVLKGLEFNEKLSREELERFNVFRREVVISNALTSMRRGSISLSFDTKNTFAIFGKGDERFEIYFSEYRTGFPVKLYLEDIGRAMLVDKSHPYWKQRRAFFEQELLNPVYTDNQRAFIRDELKKLEEEMR